MHLIFRTYFARGILKILTYVPDLFNGDFFPITSRDGLFRLEESQEILTDFLEASAEQDRGLGGKGGLLPVEAAAKLTKFEKVFSV